MEDGFGTTVRVLMNSLAFFLLLVLGGYLIKYSPLWGAVIFLSAFDQLEDVYTYVTRSRLLPEWFRPIDIIFEGVLVLVGGSMFLFGLAYWYTFSSWFFFLWTAVSAMITWSAIEDIYEDVYIITEKARGASVVATTKEIEDYKFFRKVGK